MLWLCLLSDSLTRLLLFGCLAFQHFLHGRILDVQYMYSLPLSADGRLLMLLKVKAWSTLREAQTSIASELFTDVCLASGGAAPLSGEAHSFVLCTAVYMKEWQQRTSPVPCHVTVYASFKSGNQEDCRERRCQNDMTAVRLTHINLRPHNVHTSCPLYQGPRSRVHSLSTRANTRSLLRQHMAWSIGHLLIQADVWLSPHASEAREKNTRDHFSGW